MGAGTQTSEPVRYRPGGSLVTRLVRSRGFALIISVGMHAAAFAVLYRVAFREDVQAKVIIIPEASFAPAPSSTGADAPPPLELSHDVPPALTLPDDARLADLPAASVTLTVPPEMGLRSSTSADAPASLAARALATPVDTGPTLTFFGQPGNAYKVVYVVDVSASLMIYMHEIAQEMRRSIRNLIPAQRFHIVLARPGHVEGMAPGRLVPANARYRQQAGAFLDTITGIPKPGKADPIAAMEQAFAARPELIYFLSDGDYPDVADALLQRLAELNAAQAVKITVIGFSPAPRSRGLLERIAREHGGRFRSVEPAG